MRSLFNSSSFANKVPLIHRLPGGYLDAKIAFTEVKGMSNCRADNVEVDIQAAGGFIPVEYNGTMDMNFSLPILQVSPFIFYLLCVTYLY